MHDLTYDELSELLSCFTAEEQEQVITMAGNLKDGIRARSAVVRISERGALEVVLMVLARQNAYDYKPYQKLK